MRLTSVSLAVALGACALTGAASTSAQPAGPSLQLSGVPARLTIPGSFTMTVSGSTGNTADASVYSIYGPAPCAASVEAQLVSNPYESLVSPEAGEVPPLGLAGTFTVHAGGLGEAVSSPGLYTVCVFMEASEEPEAGETSEEPELVAEASATFTALAAPGGASSAATTGRRAVRRCVVPHLRGRRLRSAEIAIARAHCALGRVRRVGARHARRGRVVWQSRRAGRSLPRGTRVGLVVGTGVGRRSPPIRSCARARHPGRHRLRCARDGRP
jgi:hypothetical protein